MKGFLATYLGIVSKLRKLDVIEQAASRLDDVFALLWSFLHFAREEKAASSRHLHTAHVLEKQHAFLHVSQLCIQGYTVCNGVFLEDESLLICKISCPYLHISETA